MDDRLIDELTTIARIFQSHNLGIASTVRDAIAEIEAHRNRTVGVNIGAPEGWQFVPVRPSMEMLAAGRVMLISASEVWAAMLATAPQPPEIPS